MLATLPVACGGDDDGTGGTELSLRQAARDFTVAFLAGDDSTAYSFYGGQCAEQVSEDQFHAFAETFRGTLEILVGPLERIYLEDVSVRDVDGRSGEARAHVVVEDSPDPALGELFGWQPWSFDDGRWLLTECRSPWE